MLEEYDPRADRWVKKTDMLAHRDAYRVAAVNGKVYVIGNLAGGSEVLEYQPATDVWRVHAPMPSPRFDFGIHASSGLIYTFGGMGARTLEVYDPAADRWLKKRPMPIDNWCQVIAELNGRLYMIGGGFPAPAVLRRCGSTIRRQTDRDTGGTPGGHSQGIFGLGRRAWRALSLSHLPVFRFRRNRTERLFDGRQENGWSERLLQERYAAGLGKSPSRRFPRH